jgi:hypothetical protein
MTIVSLDQLHAAIANARKEERERCIRKLKYYGITLGWNIHEIATKLRESDEPPQGETT